MSVTNVLQANGFRIGTYVPAFDPNRSNPANNVSNEQHVASANAGTDDLVLFPSFAPFYAAGLVVQHTPNGGSIRTLTNGVDYLIGLPFLGASRALNSEVGGAIYLINNALSGTFTVGYHTLGGNWVYRRSLDEANLYSLDNHVANTSWEQYAKYSEAFPIITAAWDKVDRTSGLDLNGSVDGLIASMVAQVLDNRTKNMQALTHINRTDNPHVTTAASIGLGNVANYPPATDLQAADPTNNTTYITPAQLSLAFSTITPTATDTSPGIMALNMGNQASDATNATDGLTAQGFYNLASSQANVLGRAVNHAQLSAAFSPWNGTWPALWNNYAYANPKSLLQALQAAVKIRALEMDLNTGKVWFPAGTTIPNMTLTFSPYLGFVEGGGSPFGTGVFSTI